MNYNSHICIVIYSKILSFYCRFLS